MNHVSVVNLTPIVSTRYLAHLPFRTIPSVAREGSAFFFVVILCSLEDPSWRQKSDEAVDLTSPPRVLFFSIEGYVLGCERPLLESCTFPGGDCFG
ncbi:hypothetical protein CEXT_144981 [Caerostris extrusa]|uniref:Uncharacterized protein n=1 Tax=Caerostris extrusa TaxID=172846 RepID=A0AAV4REL4_CAEEX|nr:hypothetical protein CEXT_144981 [Caerostris extrusa]